MQGKHEVDTWMYTGIFTACAAYNSPELRMVMSQAYQSMETQWQELQASGAPTGSGKRLFLQSLLGGRLPTSRGHLKPQLAAIVAIPVFKFTDMRKRGGG